MRRENHSRKAKGEVSERAGRLKRPKDALGSCDEEESNQKFTPYPHFFATAHSKGLSDFCAVILERREARGSTGKGRTARLDGTAKFIAYYNR
jgi:hypothetical protein